MHCSWTHLAHFSWNQIKLYFSLFYNNVICKDNPWILRKAKSLLLLSLLLLLSKFKCVHQLCLSAMFVTWEISENSLAFLDIKLSINDNGLSTSVHYKPSDSHNYLLHSFSHPQHVKNAIPFSQFLRLRRLCSDDTDFNNKCEEMCQFFKKRGYPDSAVTTGKHRAQEIDRETALQTSQNEETDRIPFTLTYHP